jgi:uncharacterized membrane protein YgcG
MCALAVALTVGLLTSMPTQAAGGHWTVSAVDGAVMVIGSGGEAYAASRGQPVVAGSTVVTEDDSAVVLTRRGDSITVYPNSEMTIPVASGAGEPGVLQGIGRLLFRMETRESRDFEVRTPFLAATVKGTTFTVVVTRTQATVSVAEGSVHVAAARGGRSEMVRPGWTATVEFDREFVGLAARKRNPTNNVTKTGDPALGDSEPSSTAPDDLKSDDSKSGGSKSDDSKSGGSKSGGSKSGGSKSGDSKSGDSKSGDSKSGDSKSGDPAAGHSSLDSGTGQNT